MQRSARCCCGFGARFSLKMSFSSAGGLLTNRAPCLTRARFDSTQLSCGLVTPFFRRRSSRWGKSKTRAMRVSCMPLYDALCACVPLISCDSSLQDLRRSQTEERQKRFRVASSDSMADGATISVILLYLSFICCTIHVETNSASNTRYSCSTSSALIGHAFAVL